MSKKILLLLCLLLTFSNKIYANEEEAPAEEAAAEEGEEGEETPAEGEVEEEDEEAEEKGEEDEEEAEEGQEMICNKQIVETYGLVGLDVAQPMHLDMCESIKHSCCQVTDQIKIFENWMDNGEDVDLLDRMNYHSRVRCIISI